MAKRKIPAHAYFAKMLKEVKGLPSLDNTAKYNKIYAIQIERRIKEEIARVKGVKIQEVKQKEILKGFENLLELAEKDDWIRTRMTDLGFIYRNFGKIIK